MLDQRTEMLISTFHLTMMLFDAKSFLFSVIPSIAKDIIPLKTRHKMTSQKMLSSGYWT